MCSAVRTQNEVGAKQEPFATVGRSADALDARLRPEATSALPSASRPYRA